MVQASTVKSNVEHYNTIWVEMDEGKAIAQCNCGWEKKIGFADSRVARQNAVEMVSYLGGSHLKENA